MRLVTFDGELGTRWGALFLRPGDVVEVEIERLGVLRNPVVGEGER
jgi:2-keto-4-pentenoate hydratase/2-oxohepta-3-ene-1,7-dioic acid hydratase in catechol pathway